MRLPTAGKQFKRYLNRFNHMAVWDGWVSGEDSRGRVRAFPGGKADIKFELGRTDMRRLQETIAKLAELFHAAGAKEVVVGVDQLPRVMNAEDAASRIRAATLAPRDFATGSNHVFGSMAMGSNPESHATDSWGKIYDIDDAYVCDTSLFPTSPSVNPQLTAMALADRLGRELPRRY